MPRLTADEARRRILDAAGPLFANRGYAGTTIQEIADGAGTGRTNVLYHFHTKVEIIRALLLPVAARFAEIADELRPLSDIDSQALAVERYVDLVIEFHDHITTIHALLMSATHLEELDDLELHINGYEIIAALAGRAVGTDFELASLVVTFGVPSALASLKSQSRTDARNSLIAATRMLLAGVVPGGTPAEESSLTSRMLVKDGYLP